MANTTYLDPTQGLQSRPPTIGQIKIPPKKRTPTKGSGGGGGSTSTIELPQSSFENPTPPAITLAEKDSTKTSSMFKEEPEKSPIFKNISFRSSSRTGFTYGGQTAPDTGIITLFPGEQSKLSGELIPYRTLKSSSPLDSLREGVFFSQIPLTPQNYLKGLETPSAFKTDIRNIALGEKLFKKNEDLTQSEIISASETATEKFNAFSTSKKIKAGIYEGFIGGSKIIIGTGEGLFNIFSNFGVKKLNEGEGINFFNSKSAGFTEGFLGDIKGVPSSFRTKSFLESPTTYLKESITPGNIGAGIQTGVILFSGGTGLITNIKQYGFGTGIKESLSYLSPLRIQSGLYPYQISPESKIEGISFIEGKNRYIYGNLVENPSVEIFSKQKISFGNTKTFSIQETKITSPFYEIRGGGTEVVKGIRTSTFIGSSVGKEAGGLIGSGGIKLFGDNFKTFVSDSATKSQFDVFINEKAVRLFYSPTKTFTKGGGLVYNLGDNLKLYRSGTGTSVYKTESFGDLVVSSPSARGVKLNVNILEFKIPTPSNKGYVSFQGGGKGSSNLLSSLYGGNEGVSAAALNIPKTPATTQSFGVVPKIDLISSNKISINFLTGIQKTTQKTKDVSINIFDTSIKSGEKQKVTPRLSSQQKTIFNQQESLKSSLGLNQVQIQTNKMTQKQKFFTSLSDVPLSPFSGSFRLGNRAGIFGFALPLGQGNFPKKSQILGRTYKYQPSLASIGLGLTSKSIPKGYETGIVTRTIVTGKKKKKGRGKSKKKKRGFLDIEI